ncbi:MAG: nitronate monooxygenase family protein [Hydrogenophaga sp.]|uniref:NAD(P)H-dependent flavin oxidoreductase n=1 Tax=Hydrogenophaga sp. TaxID=1904254 RepID=UPI00272130FF|nr:nitronate monooxygenase family protein [Hydrogenophaga sp.]MDO9570397.1 nitronate monooxygenase family protein [Hydrogenophaga sp.]MDP3376336.1 nitronate monooxygenase family protein [Hydrogenophaga sp.]
MERLFPLEQIPAQPTAGQTAPTVAQRAAELLALARSDGLRTWRLGGRELIPVVQGGMGVGVSAGQLAGTVASYGGVGTVSSVDLRRMHPDLMAQTGHLDKEPDAKAQIDAANLVALDREIQRARGIAQGRGLIAVNVMKALSAYEIYVRQALHSGADAVVVGAGLPLDLPDIAKDHPKTALIPILSDARGVQLLVRKWEKKGRLPDAIVIEHPRLAGGHLGAAKVADLQDARFDFDTVLPQVLEFFKKSGIEGQIPLIVAGGIGSRADILRLQGLGASAVQMGTAFAVTTECDADPAFKHVLADARPEDIVEFVSVAGLPARAVRTPWLDKYIRIEPKLQAAAHVKKKCNMSFDCLAHCGLRDGVVGIGQFCIDQQLGHAMEGDTDKGLFFRGAGSLPFGREIRSVHDLLQWMLAGIRPPVANH